VRSAAARLMSVLLMPPSAGALPMASPAQWQAPIDSLVSIESTSATVRRRIGSTISLSTGRRSFNGDSR
jgi:hypothetical protein